MQFNHDASQRCLNRKGGQFETIFFPLCRFPRLPSLCPPHHAQTSGKRFQVLSQEKKGNATYRPIGCDPVKKNLDVEDICLWNISTSEKTGRVTASRKILKYHNEQPLSLSEEVLTSGKPGGVKEAADVEETRILADSESPSTILNRQHPKWKHVRAVKENNSVSEPLTFS